MLYDDPEVCMTMHGSTSLVAAFTGYACIVTTGLRCAHIFVFAAFFSMMAVDGRSALLRGCTFRPGQDITDESDADTLCADTSASVGT